MITLCALSHIFDFHGQIIDYKRPYIPCQTEIANTASLLLHCVRTWKEINIGWLNDGPLMWLMLWKQTNGLQIVKFPSMMYKETDDMIARTFFSLSSPEAFPGSVDIFYKQVCTADRDMLKPQWVNTKYQEEARGLKNWKSTFDYLRMLMKCAL